ncbi:hypothetical protein P280DRAFT_491786 [Massarina eburnea CBS 473.64]|uniref:DRBM domain-containing protein n=1 Tax=Massarina eburnea CBS 473.64 TaxID=1395130 RepID=A0A6A6RT38_9PLEO|nr:hypothetical protein P280DRAFT_491786 [Massarina eburnea CBS 473.64]
MSLDDYLKTHTPPAPKEKQQPAAPKPKATLVAAVPRALGARSSKHTIRLHEKYQGLGIPQPEFEFEGGSVEGWWGKVVFRGLLGSSSSTTDADVGLSGEGARVGENGDVEVSEKGPFGSKQEAKEKLSEVALGVLEGLEMAGLVVKRVRMKKGSDDVAVEGKLANNEPVVNYVGQLLEFQRSTASPQPTYADYQLGTAFTCLITIDNNNDTTTTTTTPSTFGSLTGPYFSSKKAARHNAARLAVTHYKTQGLWPDSSTSAGGIKKPKKSLPPPQSPTTSPSTTTTTTDPVPSYAHRVATLATTLSLPSPHWSYETCASTPGFHTVTCHFPSSTTASGHEGPIGEVRHIYGKKRAKEECARLTLEYLLAVREARMEYGRDVMDGVVGGEAVVGVALGVPVGGGGEAESGDEGFVSAVEE